MAILGFVPIRFDAGRGVELNRTARFAIAEEPPKRQGVEEPAGRTPASRHNTNSEVNRALKLSRRLIINAS